ncbi:hypothetical protein FKW77_007927 [Venturia effusa]|uniref:Uncharacterized protein n=1 Tax=Venturia effusa TaxID=50376 RepID=A0A517L1Q6_9PEZI|nr:hypothetical protein FKW77_007927 [Venturia effusa]
MKSATVLSVLLAGATVQAATVPPNIPDKKVPWADVQKRQAIATLTTLMGKGGKVADPAGAAPRKQVIASPSKVAGVKRIKMRHGPYSVPNMNRTSIMGEAGALWNYPDTAIQKPCTECTIVAQRAGLEYPDGKNANIDTGMWLHHMVHLAIGPGRQDATCYGRRSLPHIDVNASPANSERYFSSGNERTFLNPDRAGAEGTKWGYHLRTTDRMAFIVDLMNMNMEDKVVYLTMTYDIIDGPLPAGWQDIKPVWFDANQCGTSEVHPPKQSGQFTITSGSWTPNFEGEVLGVGGHLHDGGYTVQVQVNNALNCDSTAKYAETPEFQFKPAMKMGAGMGMATDHVSSMRTCFFDDMKVRKLDPSQKWRIQAHYDYDKYAGNKDTAGKQEGIMAIAIMYVAVKPGTMLGGGAAPAAAGGQGGQTGQTPNRSPVKGVAKGTPKTGSSTTSSAPPMAGMPGMEGHKRKYLENGDGEAYWE